MATLQLVRHRFWDNDGSLLSGGKVYIYEPGTTTQKNSYTDSTGLIPNAWPLILDAKGEASMWTNSKFKINVTNSVDVQVTGYPVDNIISASDDIYNSFWNVAASFKSIFTNINTAARTYTFKDRNGTIADTADIATIPQYDAGTGQYYNGTPQSTDLNLCIQAGDYNFANTATNKPAGITAAGFLHVSRGANTASGSVYVHQLAMDMNGTNVGAMYTRIGSPAAGYTATWSAWKLATAETAPCFLAYPTIATTLVAATYTKIAFQAKTYDTTGAFDNVTNSRYTPQIAGYYSIGGAFAATTTAGIAYIAIYKNGAQFQSSISASGGGIGATMQVPVFLNGSTDYVELFAWHSVGQTIVTGQTNTTWFSGFLITKT